MMNIMTRFKWQRLSLLAAAVLLIPITGCDLDELLAVDDPEVVNPESLEGERGLPVVIAGAMNDFANAYSGDTNGDSYVTVTALFADEFHSSGSFATRIATDRREQRPPANENTSDDLYLDLQFARRALSDAAARLATERSTSDPAFSEMKALEGYSILLLGETFCSAVPLSTVVDGEYQYGPPLTSAMLFDTAVARFDASQAAGGGHLAAIGKGRALLAAGDFQGAVAAVAAVPTEYAYVVFHSESGSNNDVFSKQDNGRFSQSDLEGGNGIAFRSAGDPRSPWTEDPLGGFDETIPLFLSDLYTSYGDDHPLATGVEARLIEAEAALQDGDIPGMTAILNDLRSHPAVGSGGADLDVPATMPAAVSQLFEERAFWLFLTGHRMGDLRRLVYQYGRSQSDVFPTGPYHQGGDYGNDVVFPVDFDEGNNPEYDFAGCDVESAAID